MSILIVSYSKSMANHQIALSIYEQLRLNGIDCFIFDTGALNPKASEQLSLVLELREERRYFQMLLCMLKHPLLTLSATEKGSLFRNSLTVKDIVRKKGVSKVICFSQPFETGYALRTRIPPKKLVLYNVDPYALSQNIVGKMERTKRERREAKLFKKASHIFTTPLLFDEYEKTKLKKFKNKMTPLEFPCVFAPDIDTESSVKEKSSINCVYSGRITPSRNNDSVVKVIGSALEIQPELEINLYGEMVEGESGIPRLCTDYPKTVRFWGRVTPRESLKTMCNCDILINIGNKVSNQLPSKVLTYISTGKPIVNFYWLENDTSIPYIDRYPLGINICVNSPEAAQSFLAFCNEMKGKRVEFETVKKVFCDCTPECVARQMLTVLCNN